MQVINNCRAVFPAEAEFHCKNLNNTCNHTNDRDLRLTASDQHDLTQKRPKQIQKKVNSVYRRRALIKISSRSLRSEQRNTYKATRKSPINPRLEEVEEREGVDETDPISNSITMSSSNRISYF